MKTTIEIPNALFAEIKAYSSARKSTFKAIVESALRSFLNQNSTPQKRFKLKKCSFRGEGMVHGLDEQDFNEIRKRAYEGRGG
jgi:hypothetical protein